MPAICGPDNARIALVFRVFHVFRSFSCSPPGRLSWLSRVFRVSRVLPSVWIGVWLAFLGPGFYSGFSPKSQSVNAAWAQESPPGAAVVPATGTVLGSDAQLALRFRGVPAYRSESLEGRLTLFFLGSSGI